RTDAAAGMDTAPRTDAAAGTDTAPRTDAAQLDDAGHPGLLIDAVSRLTITVDTGAVSGGDYEYGPFLAAMPDGRAKLAWCDASAQKVYLRHLDNTLAASERSDTAVDGYKLFGLAAHGDGRSALLVVTPAPGVCTPCTPSSSCVSCNELHLVQVDAAGAVTRDQVIDDRLAHGGQYSGGAIALGTCSGAETYAVARTVRGAGPDSSASAHCVSGAGNSGHQWHETWLYRASDLAVVASGCNVFPCGHSLFKRSIAWHAAFDAFGSVCISDYSGNRTGFNFAIDSGWNHRIYNVWSDWPDFVNGGTPGELVTATSSSYLAILSAPQSCASNCDGDDHDIALFEVSHGSHSVVGGPYWIGVAAGWQKYPHLARYGDSFLIGWTGSDGSTDFSTPTHWWLAEVDGAGTIARGPEESTGVASFGYGSNWVTIGANGDVAWPRRASSTAIEIVRVAR
ncbi:MAG: hypothetical protein JXR83_06700, partial [Deltaproteobacteria bacterium]|nr:hypothetical protein [Deltaproteobacteria bacterium]